MTTEIHEEVQIDPQWLTKKSYLRGGFISIFTVILGLVTSSLINRFYPFGDTLINVLQGFSFVPGYAAVFGVPGWDIQTWSGHSPAELLNQKLFNRLSFIGLYLPVVAFSLQSSATTELSSALEDRIVQKVKADILRELNIPNSIPLTNHQIHKSQLYKASKTAVFETISLIE